METYLDMIPEELLIEIFSYLDFFELIRLKSQFDIIRLDKFWRFKLHSDNPNFKLTEYLSKPEPISQYNIRGIYYKEVFRVILDYDANITDQRRKQRGIKCNFLRGGQLMLSNIMWYLNIQIPMIYQNLYEALYYFLIVYPFIFYSSNPSKILYFYNNIMSRTNNQMCYLIQQHLINNNLIV